MATYRINAKYIKFEYKKKCQKTSKSANILPQTFLSRLGTAMIQLCFYPDLTIRLEGKARIL